MTILCDAVAIIEDASSRAELRGDVHTVTRLRLLGASMSIEAEYESRVAGGAPMVRRRQDAPPGVALGWYLRRDTATRAARRTLGLLVQEGGP